MYINEEFLKPYRAVTYNRCSTDMQEEALEIQVRQSVEICSAYKWDLVEQYIELETGTSTSHRKRYKDMMADMETDKFDIIVIKSLDRLNRDMFSWYQFVNTLEAYGKRLFIYMDNKFYDPDKDELISGINMLIHSQFSRNLSSKIRKSHEYRQKNKSGYNISRKIYGWDKVGKDQYVINEEEANYLRYAFQLIREGYGFYRIARKLYEMGARNTIGGMIAASTLCSLCTSPRVYGCMVLHKAESKFKSDKRIEIPKDKWVYCENALPAIISKEEYDEICAIVKSRKAVGAKGQYHGKYPLSGKIYCGICGSKFHRMCAWNKRSKKNSPIWKCVKKAREGVVEGNTSPDIGCSCESVNENKLIELIEETSEKYLNSLFSSDDNIIERCLVLIRKMLYDNSDVKKLERLRKELDKLNSKKSVLFDKLMDGVINDGDFKKFNTKLTEDIEETENKIKLIEANVNNLSMNEKRLEEIRQTLQNGDFIKSAKGNSFIDKVEKIIVNGDGTVTIKYDKQKLLGLLPLYDMQYINQDDDTYSVTVVYDGTTELKKRTRAEKLALIELIKQYPTLSYSQYAKKMGGDFNSHTAAARISILKKHGIIKRNDDGSLSVIGELK